MNNFILIQISTSSCWLVFCLSQASCFGFPPPKKSQQQNNPKKNPNKKVLLNNLTVNKINGAAGKMQRKAVFPPNTTSSRSGSGLLWTHLGQLGRLSTLKTKDATKVSYNVLLQLPVLLLAAAGKEKKLFTQLRSLHQNCSQTAAGTPQQLPLSNKNE